MNTTTTEKVGFFTVRYGPARASAVFGQGGNSPWADWEVPYTITSEKGEVIARGVCTTARVGARRHAQRIQAE